MPEKKKTYFDTYVDDSYVNDTKTIGREIQKVAGTSPWESYFEGGRSPEFYKGMLAGTKAFMSVVNSFAPANFESLSNLLMDMHRCIVDKID